MIISDVVKFVAFWLGVYALIGFVVSRVLRYLMNDHSDILLVSTLWPIGVPILILSRALNRVVRAINPTWSSLLRAFDYLMVYHVMARPIQQDHFGVLCRTTLPSGQGLMGMRRQGRFVLVHDHKTKHAYRLGVPLECRTAQEGLAWTAGMPTHSFYSEDRQPQYNPIVEA